MDPNETMVEEDFDEAAADDTLPDGVAEETDESEESIESFIGDVEEDEGEAPAEESEEKPAQGTSEPGWIKQRVNKAVQKAIAETEARMQAMFEQQMAPIREKMIEDEAQELVKSRKVTDIETARELVRLRKGMAPAAEQPQEQGQPRQQNGQFAPREDPAEIARTEARIEMLKHQAARIRSGNGPDVIAEFNSNPEIKEKVIAGEMDFYDVAETLKKSGDRKRPPSPTRSPNGANGVQPRSIENMTDAQFRKMDRMLDEGVRFTLKR